MYLPSGVHSGDQYPCALALGQRPWIGAIVVRDPDVLVAAAIREEDNLRSVRRVSWLRVEVQPRRNPRCRPARDGQGIEVTDQLEHDRAAIRRHVERDPRSFAGLEIDRSIRLERQIFFLFLIAALLLLFLSREAGRSWQQAQPDHEGEGQPPVGGAATAAAVCDHERSSRYREA